MFKTIHSIEDVRPWVQDKKEIRFHTQHNGTVIGCYLFMDSSTFDSVEALECRGIIFDADGAVCSRPLHKFFNMGEKVHLMPDALRARTDIVRIYEKLDGSMIATAWVNNALWWRSKKSFGSDVVTLTRRYLADETNANITEFATAVAAQGMTAIFELTHPEARIVVAPDKPRLRLLHIRDNVTGEYVLLNPAHGVHALIAQFSIEQVPVFPELTFEQALLLLEGMTEHEGYVLQFANGDMVKVKCPWYQRLHRSITFLRERDIALSALNEELDDLKGVLAEAGIDLGPVNEVEHRLKTRLIELTDEIDRVCKEDAALERKEFAVKNNKHPLFGLIMMQYGGRELSLKDWFIRNKLKEEFGLRVLADGALAEALEG
jgi:RNA ligase